MKRRLALAAAVGATVLGLLPGAAGAWTSSCCLPWQQPAQLAITPDGRFAYASDYTVALAFARDPDTGALSVLDSYDANGGGTTELSPDGRTLYVVSTVYPTIAEFSRDVTTGALTHIGDYDDGKPSSGPPRYRDIVFTHDGGTAYVTDGASVQLVARDPATGLLGYRSELRAGDAAAPGLTTPSAIELSPDERFLYVAQGADPLLVLARDSDGGLTQQQQTPASASDLALAPDGKRLYAGPDGPLTFERDPDTGLLTLLGDAHAPASDSGVSDAQLLPTADGTGLYSIGYREHRIYQFAVASDGLQFVKTYRENVDGQGIRNPRGISASPDGVFVYLGAGAIPTQLQPGRVATFRRDGATNQLTFTSLYEGPYFDGHPPGESPAPTVTINDGAAYTNDPDVTLTVRGVDWPSAFVLQVSNDGGFTPDASEWFPTHGPTSRYSWTLATSGPERLPKTVYVRAFVAGGEQAITDEIVLDQRPPELLGAEQVVGAVRVSARDRLSGIARMQITRDRRKPGVWRKFHARTKFRTGRRALYVRVRDRAGNRSKWVTAKGRR